MDELMCCEKERNEKRGAVIFTNVFFQTGRGLRVISILRELPVYFYSAVWFSCRILRHQFLEAAAKESRITWITDRNLRPSHKFSTRYPQQTK
jgi:hypothetical protein